MSSQTAQCPLPATLEAIASGEVPPAEVLEHLSRCNTCAEYMESARFSRRFAEVMQTTGASVDSVQPSLFGYQILGEIARGGQGVVYRARQLSSGQLVAIKVLHGTDSLAAPTREARHRFLREIELIASLRTPGIARVLDSLKLLDGRDALVMDLVEGRTLDRWRATDPPPAERAKIEVLASIAETVHHAHQRGVTHRDLKPSNIIVDPQGRPWIVDFGVARSTLTPSLADRVTRTGQFTGTLAYAAPEQVAPVSPAPDVRTDVYAIGMMGFELLTDALPYAVDGSLESTVRNILEVSPCAKPPEGIRKDVWHVLSKACAKAPSRRYQSAFDLSRDLRSAAAGGAVEARGDSQLYLLRKALERNKLAVGLLSFGVVAVVAIAILLAIGNAKLDSALRESRLSEIRAHLAAGEREEASRLIWQELTTSRGEGRDLSGALWSGELHSRRLLWRAMQMQAEAACLVTLQFDDADPSRLVAGADGRLGLINLRGEVRVIEPSTGLVVSEHAISVAADSKSLWLASDLKSVVSRTGHEVSLIDCWTDQVVRTVKLPERMADAPLAWVNADMFFAISRDGHLLVLSLRDFSTVFERSGVLRDQLVWHDAIEGSVTFLDEDSALVTESTERDGRPSWRSEPLFGDPIRGRLPQVVLSTDRSLALVSHRDGIEVLRRRESEYVRERSINTGYLTRMTLSQDGLLLGASAFGDANLRLWDTRSFLELPPLSGHHGTVFSAVFAEDGERMATVDASGVFRLWGDAGSVWRRAIGQATNMAHQVAFDKHSGSVFFADNAGMLRSQHLESSTSPVSLEGLAGVRVAIDESGQWLAYAASMGVVTIVPLVDGRLHPDNKTRLEFGEDLRAIRFGPESSERAQTIAVGTASGEVSLIEASGGNELWRTVLPQPVWLSDLRWTPDGRSLVASTRRGALFILDGRSGQVVRPLSPSSAQIRSLYCSEDSRFVYAVGDEGHVLRVDLMNGHVTRSDRLSEHSLFAIACDSRRGLLFIGTRDGLVMALDARSLIEVATFTAGGAVLDLVCVPGADTLVISAVDRPVELWNFKALSHTLFAGLGPPAR